jgi:hypothetical protein
MKTYGNVKVPVSPGRKPKGDRVTTTARIERTIHAEITRIAERDNLPFGDVLSRLAAQALDLPVPVYCKPQPHPQDQLALVVGGP